jgi:hypothetical protein
MKKVFSIRENQHGAWIASWLIFQALLTFSGTQTQTRQKSAFNIAQQSDMQPSAC